MSYEFRFTVSNILPLFLRNRRSIDVRSVLPFGDLEGRVLPVHESPSYNRRLLSFASTSVLWIHREDVCGCLRVSDSNPKDLYELRVFKLDGGKGPKFASRP